MKLLLTILTCEGRESALGETLASLNATDWNEEPLIVKDTTKHADRRISQTTTAFQLLTLAETKNWDYLLFCEDDVDFNLHLRRNLTVWLSQTEVTVGTLYNSDRESSYPSWEIGGSQAIVLRRTHLSPLFDQWHQFPSEWMQDLRMYRSVKMVPIHQPNLVQHRQMNSTWGGRPHQSVTFNQTWLSELAR